MTDPLDAAPDPPTIDLPERKPMAGRRSRADGAGRPTPRVRRPGEQGLYVITADPQAVWERCRAAGVDVVREPESPHYDPDGMVFSIRDPEGNSWSFGTYAGGATG